MSDQTEKYQLLKSAYSAEGFKDMADKVLDTLIELFPTEKTAHEGKSIPYVLPEEQYAYWTEEFKSGKTTLPELVEKFVSHSLILSNKRNVAHQLSVTLPITMLTSAVNSRLNNVPTHYQLGMPAITMERIVVEHMLKKFGFNPNSTGTICTGGSMGNLTALVTARSKYETFLTDKSQAYNFAILVSEAAHYSIERSAMVMGLRSENIIQVPINKDCTVKTELLEEKLLEARKQKKIVFCVVGCASTTSHGAHDDLTKLGEFARKHNIWFHIDGAHGGAAIFSKKYKHLLKGVELCDSIIIDFHKMLMVPTTSTAILYNRRPEEQNAAPRYNIPRSNSTPCSDELFSPLKYIGFSGEITSNDVSKGPIDFDAPYLFNSAQSNEWYEGGHHTLECSKPTVIFHTYAILRIYGDEILEQNVDALYDMGIKFGEMVDQRENIKLALKPQNNIVCFRYETKALLEQGQKINKVNDNILESLLTEGIFYLSNCPIFGSNYLRVTFMNPFTDEEVLNEILNKVEELGKAEESKILSE